MEHCHSYLVLRGADRGRIVSRSESGGYGEHSHHLPTPSDLFNYPHENLAPLTEAECLLLDVIWLPEARDNVYRSPGKLKWGLGLKVGDTVLAQLLLPGKKNVCGSSGSVKYAAAIIKWYGEVVSSRQMIGVEIMEHYHGCGNTNGVYQGERYFTCNEDCGLFLTLDKIEIPLSSNGTSSSAVQEYTSQLERDLAVKTQEICQLQQQLSSTEMRLQQQIATLQTEISEKTETVMRLQGEVGARDSKTKLPETANGFTKSTKLELLKTNREKIEIAATLNMIWLAHEMNRVGLLPDDVNKDVTNARSLLTEDQKAREMVEALIKLVSINPLNYMDKFVDILKKKPIYSGVVELLHL